MVGRFQPSVDWWKTQKRTQRQVRILAVGEEELDLLLGAFRPKMIVHITFHVLLMNSVFPFVPSSGSQFSSEIKSERKSTPPEGVQVTSNQAKYQKRNAPAEGTYPVLFILGFDAGILLDDIRKFRGGTSTLSRVFSCLTWSFFVSFEEHKSDTFHPSQEAKSHVISHLKERTHHRKVSKPQAINQHLKRRMPEVWLRKSFLIKRATTCKRTMSKWGWNHQTDQLEMRTTIKYSSLFAEAWSLYVIGFFTRRFHFLNYCGNTTRLSESHLVQLKMSLYP